MPSLSRMPARSMEPAVGASVWASGNQVWNGNIGVLTAKAMAMPRKSHRPVFVARLSLAMILVKSKLTVPPSPALAMTARATIDTSMNAEPAIV